MKSKFSYILIILVLSFAFVNNVFANELTVSSVVDSTTVDAGSEVSVKVNLMSTEAIKECAFKFDSTDMIEFVSKQTLGNGWSVDKEGADGVHITNGSWDVNTVTNENIIELKYKVNGDGSLVIKTIQCLSETNTYEHTDVSINFTVIKSEKDTTLKSLKVINGTMEPTDISVSHEGNYIITLNSSTFGLEMVANDSVYQDEIVVTDSSGNVIKDVSNITFVNSNNQGQMPLIVTVGGETKYNLLITYTQKNLDNSLSSITINGKNLSLEKGKYNYTYTVGKDVTEFVVAAVIKDNENFKFGSSSNAPDTFTIGNNLVNIVIVVEPKDSSLDVGLARYEIEVTREKDSSNDDDKDPVGSGNTGTGNSNSNNEVSKNPGTADIPMLLMAVILICSLGGSVFFYKKNMESYK